MTATNHLVLLTWLEAAQRVTPSIINAAPKTPRAMVLHRVLSGLKNDQVRFRESDVFALDADAIALVDALVSDTPTGRYTSADLERALQATTVPMGKS